MHCGSGKKYKNCHLRADEATPHGLRLISGGLAPSQAAANPKGLRLPPGTVVSSAWEVDLVPLAEGGHPAAVATLSHSAALLAVDAAVDGLHAHMGGAAEHEGTLLRISRPATWAAWGLEREQLARFFAAAERYFVAAPWEILMNEDVMRAKVRGGGTWWAMAMGAAREVYGLVMHAERADVERILMNSRSGDMDTAVGGILGATISLGFEPRADMPKQMREEIRREKWPVAGPEAYPMMFVLNTPGGGISARQMEDLIAVLTAVPAFVDRHAAGITGVVPLKLPLSYRNTASGVTITLEYEWLL